MLGLKIFLGVMIALMLLGIIGARTKCSKSIAGAITICCIVLLTAIIAKENQPKVTEVAPESGKIQTKQNAWGTITVTDDTGVTREYQGCIHISGTYPYETNVGDCIEVRGRLQSREYTKELEHGETEVRTCYELSIEEYKVVAPAELKKEA